MNIKSATALLAATLVLIIGGSANQDDSADAFASTAEPEWIGGLSLISTAQAQDDETDEADASPAGDWYSKKWRIRRVSGVGGAVLMKPNAANRFWLKPVMNKGKIVYYKVKFKAGDMTDHWKGVILFPRGSKTYPAWPTAKKLTPWNDALVGPPMDAQKELYRTTINSVLTSAPINTSTNRLEGDVMVGGVAEALTLLVVKDAITDGSEMLLVDLNDTSGSGTVQDGSGSGDPR